MAIRNFNTSIFFNWKRLKALNLWLLVLCFAMLALVAPEARATTVNLNKFLCSGVSSNASSCTIENNPQIGDPVYYEITIANTLNSPSLINLQEDLPLGFRPADSVNFVSCANSLGNAVASVVSSYTPVVIDMTLPPSDDVVCVLDGYFVDPGEIATNTVSETSLLADPSNVTVVVQPDINFPVDLSLTKTANTTGPLDLSGGPVSVTYTLILEANGDVYIDDYLTLYDQISMFTGGVPLNAQLNPGSVNCTTTAMGGASYSCPIANNFSGVFLSNAWSAFVSFGFGNSQPILFSAGDTMTLSYTVAYSLPLDQTCVQQLNSNGVNNRAFLGLSNGSQSLGDINASNNDTANAGSVPIPVFTDLPADPDCVGGGGGGSGPPSALSVSKTLLGYVDANGNSVTGGAIPWDQQYVSYRITVNNASLDEVAYDNALTDIYSNLTYTPNHEVTLHSVDIASCPVTSVCAITDPNPWPTASPQGPMKPINSYFDSALIFKGTIDTLAPGEVAEFDVRLTLRNPTCDFAPLQQPKTVRNSISVRHTIDREDPFDGLMKPNFFTKTGLADAVVETTDPCDFAVNKTVINAPNEIEFGVPMNYTLEFQNGASAIHAGTLIDVLRIEQDYYALGMTTDYSFTCTETPTGSVTNFVGSYSNTGTVSYGTAPHRGLRVMEHPGFVNFAPNAKLTCNVTVTVQAPAQNDPYCFSNGTPTIGNAAIIDGSLFYNANQTWPLSPQYTMWDAVSSELPKCVHLVVNKSVSPLTTTPNFGPDLVYTVDIINASGSGTAGDIDFTPTTMPWSGPVLTDTFQTGPFPIAPPQNIPQMTVDPCNGSGDPCRFITPISTTGHVMGLSKLAAGSSLSYSYSLPSPYTPHEMCNDLDGELVINGLPPERWYVKNTQTWDDANVCALIRTNLELTKTFDIHSSLNLPASTAFTVDINCTPPEGFNPTAMSQTLTIGGPVKTQKNIVVGSSCTIVERVPDESVLPSHCDWNPPAYPNGQSFIADGSVEPHQLTVHNSTVCRFGDVRINKTVTGLSQPPSATLFDFALNCGTPANSNYTASVAASASDTILQIPDGSACTLTESTPTTFMDPQGRTCTYGAPIFSPSSTATVDENNIQNISVENPVTCIFLADLTINKVLTPVSTIPAMSASQMYQAQISCIDPYTGNSLSNGSVSASASTPNVMTGLPTPATCTLTETPPQSLLPDGCTGWGPVTYQPSQTISLPAQAGSSGSITMINTPICPPRGYIHVKKQLAPGSEIPPAGTLYSYDRTCTNLNGIVTTTNHTIAAGGTDTYHDYLTTQCMIAETLPSTSAGCQWEDAQYLGGSGPTGDSSTANYVSGAGTTVTMVNKLNCMPELTLLKALDLSVTFDGTSNLILPAGLSFDVDFICEDALGNQTFSDQYILTPGTAQTVSGVPLSDRCTLTETPPSYQLPAHCSWGSPDYEPGQSVPIQFDPSVTNQTYEVINSPVCEFAAFKVVKRLTDNSLQVPSSIMFDIDVSCDTGFAQTLTVPAGGGGAITGVPSGSLCTVSETPPTAGLPNGCSFETPIIDDPTRVITAGASGETFEVYNELSCKGDLYIEKSVTLPAGETLMSGTQFPVDLYCELPDGTSSTQVVYVTDNNSTPEFVTSLPIGSTCHIEEQPLGSLGLPEHCRWIDPEYERGQKFKVRKPGQKVTLFIENIAQCDYGNLTVTKSWGSGTLYSVGNNTAPAGLTYPVNVSCSDGSTFATNLSVGSSHTFNNVPAGVSCSVSETLPAHPETGPGRICRFANPVYQPSSSVSVAANGTHAVNIRNSDKCRVVRPLIKTYVNVEKVVNAPGLVAQNASYDVSVTCGGTSRGVSVTPGTLASAGDFGFLAMTPGGCTVTETPPSQSLLPDNCTWNPPEISPSTGIFPATVGNETTVTVTNTATCVPVPGTLDIVKVVNLPQGLSLTPAPTFPVNITCINLPFTFGGWSGSSPSLNEGLNASVVTGTSQACIIDEPLPVSPLPNGCSWMPPVYPNGKVALLNSGQTETRTITNTVLCQEGSFKVEKAFHPDSEDIGELQDFQVRIDCGAPMNTSTVHTISATSTHTETGILGTGCTVTELTPPDVEYCSWEPVVYESGGVSSTNPAQVETDLTVPTVTLTNKLVCDFPPPDLSITKTLIDNQPCFDQTTGLFDCDFEITVTNTGAGPANGPFTVTDTLSGLYSYIPPTDADSGWGCALPVPNYPTPLASLSCDSPANLNIAANGGNTDFVIDTHGFALFPPTENCAGLFDQDGQYVESCVDLLAPKLEIEKVLLTPNCAENPTTECLFEVIISNVGTLDYNGTLFVQDQAGSTTSSFVLNTTITSGPTNGWQSLWPQGTTTTSHFFLNNAASIPVGGSISFQIGTPGQEYRANDLPQNCASLVFSNPLQESCVPVPWTPSPWMNIEKSLVSCPTPSACTFEITVSNASSSIAFNDPVSIDDAVSPSGGTYVSNSGNYTCSGTDVVTCDSNGPVPIAPLGSTSFQITMDLSGGLTPEENCATLTSSYNSVDPVACVPITFPPAPELDIEKIKVTPGSCNGMGPSPQACTFEITVTNSGATQFNDFITVQDAVTNWPNAAIISYSDVADWTCTQPGFVDCVSNGAIALTPGQSVTLTLTLDMAHPAFVEENCASITSPAYSPMPESCVGLEAAPSLDIVKTLLSPLPCFSNCEFEITIVNQSNVLVSQPMTVQDTILNSPNLPLGDYVSNTGNWNCSGVNGSFACTSLGNVNIPANDSVSFTLTLNLAPQVTQVENCATLEQAPPLANITSCVPLTPQPVFDITKTQLTPGVCHGGTIPGGANPNLCEFEITITNQGPGSYQGDVMFSDLVGWGVPGFYGPTPPTAFSPPPWNCLPNGNATECTYPNVNMAVGDSLTMTVTLDMISITGAPPTENCATLETPAQNPFAENCIPIGLTPQLTIQKTQITPGDCYNPPANGQCEFEITIFNTGSVDYFGQLTVDDNVLLNGSQHAGSLTTQPVSPWYCATQGAGDFLCETNGAVTVPAGGSESFTVIVNLSHPVRADQNCATLSGPVIAPPPMSCVPLTPSPQTGINIEKTLVAPCLNGICQYEITYTNYGPATLNGTLIVSDSYAAIGNGNPLYQGMTSVDGWTCGANVSNGTQWLNCNLTNASLSAGDSTSFVVSFDLSAGGTFDNCAATWDAIEGQTHQDCVTVTIPDPVVSTPTDSLLDISKTLGNCNYQGGPCTFNITVTNLGPDPFSGPVTFNDLISVGGNYFPTTNVISITPSDWSCVPASGLGNDCSTTVLANSPIPVGGTLDATLTLGGLPNMFSMHGNNCVTLTGPAQIPPPLDCIPVGQIPMSFLQVTKVLAADSDPSADPATVFPINVNCGSYNTSTDYMAGQTELLEVDMPSGPCTITESAPPAPANPNCAWDAPVYSPSNSISIPQGGVSVVTVTNRLVCGAPLDAMMEVTKQYASDSDWTPSNSFVHELQATCVNATGAVVHSATVPLDWIGYMGGLPSGTTCSFTEIPDASILPSGCTWEPPVFSNNGSAPVSVNGFEVFSVENKAVCQSVNDSNLSIEKTFLNGTCINSPSGECEFLIRVTNNSGTAYTDDINLADLVSAAGFGNGGGIGANLTNYSSADPWVCAQAGQGIDCDVSPITLAPNGGSTDITMVINIPPGLSGIKNCVQIDEPVQNPLPEACVIGIEPQSMVVNSGGANPAWEIGVGVSVPVGGTIVSGDSINDLPFPDDFNGPAIETPIGRYTESSDVSFADAFSPGIDLSLGMSRPINDRWSLTAGLGYQHFNGGNVTLGSIYQAPTRRAAITGRFDDWRQFSAVGGLRYTAPAMQIGSLSDLKPYADARIGAAYVSPLKLRGASLGGAAVNGGTIPMYKSSLVPKLDLRLGIDIPLNDNAVGRNLILGLETGMEYSGALRSDADYFGSGDPLAGTNNSSGRYAMPFRMKLKSEF